MKLSRSTVVSQNKKEFEKKNAEKGNLATFGACRTTKDAA
jgi:hypothetical protein